MVGLGEGAVDRSLMSGEEELADVGAGGVVFICRQAAYLIPAPGGGVRRRRDEWLPNLRAMSLLVPAL